MSNTEGMFCFEDEHVGCVCGWCELAPCDIVGHEFDVGVCLICEAEDEDYEPTDAQIFAHYGQTKEPGVAA